MSNKSDSLGPGSRIIRERAMNVLRETRAKIDPRLLAAMKERISSIMPGQAGVNIESKNAASPVAAPVAAVPEKAKTAYPARKFQETPPIPLTEPVDKQKIAQIVLQYMKNREDKQKH